MSRRCLNPACNAPLVRKPGETLAKFEQRKTCGRACMGALFTTQPRQVNPLLEMPELPVLAGLPLSHEVIGDMLGMSRTAVQQAEERAMRKIRAACGDWSGR